MFNAILILLVAVSAVGWFFWGTWGGTISRILDGTIKPFEYRAFWAVFAFMILGAMISP